MRQEFPRQAKLWIVKSPLWNESAKLVHTGYHLLRLETIETKLHKIIFVVLFRCSSSLRVAKKFRSMWRARGAKFLWLDVISCWRISKELTKWRTNHKLTKYFLTEGSIFVNGRYSVWQITLLVTTKITTSCWYTSWHTHVRVAAFHKMADNDSTPPFPAVHENELSERNERTGRCNFS